MHDNNVPYGTPGTQAMAANAKPGIVDTATQMNDALVKMTGLLLALEKRLAMLEKASMLRVTISSAQARAVQKAVVDRAKSLCDDNELAYEQFGAYVRGAIWRAFRAEYAVPTAYDLPEVQYASALETVRCWHSFAFMRKLRRAVR